MKYHTKLIIHDVITSTYKSTLTKAPFIFITLAYILGIIYSSEKSISNEPSILFIELLLLSILCVSFSLLWKRMQLLFLFLWFIGFGVFLSQIQKIQHSELKGDIVIFAKITSPLEEKNKTFKTEILCITEKGKTANAIIYIQKNKDSKLLQFGDIIKIHGNFHEIENSPHSSFDYKKYLANKYIYSQAYISAKNWIFTKHTQSLQSISFKVRTIAIHKLQNSEITTQDNSILAALVFGDKSMLNSEITQAFATTGAMHILSVSGLHVAIISSMLIWIFSFFPKSKFKILKTVLCICGIWAYTFITGISPPVLRAAVMCSMFSLSFLIERQSNTYNTLAAAAFISLLMNPNYLFDVGFQLSYLAVLGILYFTPFFQKLFTFDNKIFDYIWGIIAVSLAVQITTIPISLYYFKTFPTYSILTNIIVIPVSFIILANAIIMIFVASIPIISNISSKLLHESTSYLYNVISDIVSFPHAKIPCIVTFNYMIFLYVLIFIGILGIEFYKELRIQKELFV